MAADLAVTGGTIMKAVVCHQYGSPDVLQVEEIEKPTPGDGEVLIKIHAASTNPADWHVLRADPFIVRISGFGLFKPKTKILGADIAGTVEAVGQNVKQFKAGDEVFGDIFESGMGAFAEYVSTSEDALVLKPAALTFAQAAAVPLAAVTALHAIRDHGKLQAGQKVLINGASGGVGSFAVQIAKALGAEVTGVTSTRNVEMVRSLGADHVIDYTREDFTAGEKVYDLIIGTAGSSSAFEVKRVLSPDGHYVFIGGANFPGTFVAGLWISMTSKQKMISMINKANQKDLGFVAELIEAGKVTPVIDRSFPLIEVADAIAYLEKGHAQGKVVITM
ncbi:MAG: NAD(P)-dependent alcohol dehydrogenase [Rhodospirillaceae bacterium]|nr:NAD(P)-dependent alcohol dehydrogenase [Rhodospirillaceae bacterium]